LKRPETKDIDAAVDAVLSGDIARVRELGAPLTIAGDIQRSVICAAPGHKLITGDFSAIESRVLAWLANEKWKLETYRRYDETGDSKFEPYCVMASQALKRIVTPEDEAGRQFGKTYDLAFGFGGGRGAWRKFDTSDTYSDAEVENFKCQFRRTHRATLRFWHALERAAHRSVRSKKQHTLDNRLCFDVKQSTLFMTLPSGRRLAYPEAHMVPGKFENSHSIRHKNNAKGAWTDVDTWYGTLVENAVQAVARDLLVAAMQRLEAADYKVVLHVHDEIVCEVSEDFGSEEEFLRIMLELPDWAAGLPIAGKVRSGKRYAKSSAKRVAEGTTETEPLQLQVGISGVPEPGATDQRTSGLPDGSESDHNLADAENDDDDDETEVLLADLIDDELGDDKMMCCPFHADSTPSMKIYHDHYHCFGCGAHGGRIDWLMAVEGHSRAEATHLIKNWDGPITQRQSSVGDDALKRASALHLWEEAPDRRHARGSLSRRYPRRRSRSAARRHRRRAALSSALPVRLRPAASLSRRAHAQRRDRRADRNPPYRLDARSPQDRALDAWQQRRGEAVAGRDAARRRRRPRDRARCRLANSLRRQAVEASLGCALSQHAGRLSSPQRRRTADHSSRPRQSRIDRRSDLRRALDPRRAHRRAADA
jgi:hypothetical protein